MAYPGDQIKSDTEQMFEELGQSLEYALGRALDASCRKGKENFQGMLGTLEDGVRRYTSGMIQDDLINPTISGLMQNFSAAASPTISPVLGALGAGGMGYLASGGGMGAAGGSALGFLAGGTLGAELGGIVGNFIDGMKENKPKIPSFDLLWETVDGQLQLVTDSWVNMPKDAGVFKAAQVFVESQVDFFEKLTTIVGSAAGKVPEFSFSLSGAGAGDIQQILSQQKGISIASSAMSAYPQLSELFGPGFTEDFRKVFMDALTPNLGMFSFGQSQDVFQKYMDWKFDQLTALPADQAGKAFTDWMGQQAIFSPVGRPGIQANSIYDLYVSRNPGDDATNPDFSQLEQFAKTVTSGWFNQGEIAFSSEGSTGALSDFFTDLNSQVTELFNTVTTGMGAAFTASLKTGEYQTFEDSFKASIMSSTQAAMIKGFAEQELMPAIFAPFYGSSGSAGYTEILKQYQAGELTLPETVTSLQTIFTGLSTTLANFQPVWETLNTGFESLGAAIGYNTTATEGNTAAVMGPVDAFLQNLQSGSLAAGQSLAGMETTKEQYYSAAFGDSKDFQAYASWMAGSYLPQQKILGNDYGGVVTGTIADVKNIPWVQAANGAAVTAADIGAQVAYALGPMMLAIKDAARITVNVAVDGQVIQTAIIDSLNNPSVVQALRAKM